MNVFWKIHFHDDTLQCSGYTDGEEKLLKSFCDMAIGCCLSESDIFKRLFNPLGSTCFQLEDPLEKISLMIEHHFYYDVFLWFIE